MNYKPAVEAALKGDDSGFSFLYEVTYRNMYYVALKYLKNEDAAQDVLQDAYLKAWKSLDTLKDPDNFPAWLGRIVANTAKNQLVKKNPILFSETEQENEEGDSFVYEIEDDSGQYQPELKYSAEETQTLVREMIDSLSDEQRMCVIMYYLEEQSVRDIAEALEISENTVKSRLFYSRKALKGKAEELQKRGYDLYGVSPIFLLLRLLETEQSSSAVTAAADTVGRALSNTVIKHGPAQATASLEGSAGAGGAAQAAGAGSAGSAGGAAQAVSAGSAASKTAMAFLHTAVGKAVAGITAVAIIGGSTAAVALHPWSPSPEPVAVSAPVVSSEVPVEPESTPTPTPAPTEAPTPTPASAPRELRDEEYSQLISGNLTREDLQYLLAQGPQTIPEGGFAELTEQDQLMVLIPLLEGNEGESGYHAIRNYGSTENGQMLFSAEDVRRILSALPSGEKLLDALSFSEDGQYVETSLPSTQTTIYATINSTEYNESQKEIRVHYTYDYHKTDMPQLGNDYVQDKIATLTPDETGRYRITKIEDDAGGQSVAEAYEGVLSEIAALPPTFAFTEMQGMEQFVTGEYQYCLYDMDGDGLQELIVGAVFMQDHGVLPYKSCHVYTCVEAENGYIAQPVEGRFYALQLYIPSSGSGLYRYEMTRMSGEESIYRVTMQDGVIQSDMEPEQTFYREDEDSKAFSASNWRMEWSDISDTELLKNTEFTAVQ